MSGLIRSLSLFLVAIISSCATVNTPISDTPSENITATKDHTTTMHVASVSTAVTNPSPANTDPSLPDLDVPSPEKKNLKKPATAIFLTTTPSNEKTEPVAVADPNRSIWEVLQSNLSLSYDLENPRIHQERQRYVKNPAYLNKVTERAEPYLFHIIKSLNEASLPLELIALPIVESAYKSTAKSHHGAEGLWQFIRSTGKVYGLQRNWWYDGRRDPLEATEAAIAYLKRLNKIYAGDWLLSLAAYNAGENAVNRAIKKNRKRGLPEDYWNLKLPKETMKYVPRFLAVVSILENPDIYDIALHPVKHTGYFESVSVSGRTSLTRLAQQLKLDKKLVLTMNAGHRRGITPPEKKTTILLPQEAAAYYQTIQSEIAEQIEIAALTHRVQKGETLSHISKHYGIPVIKIKANNKIRGSLIRPGQKLQIPES